LFTSFYKYLHLQRIYNLLNIVRTITNNIQCLVDIVRMILGVKYYCSTSIFKSKYLLIKYMSF